MARLNSYNTLCPLIDKQLLGVEADSTPDCVIVTLGKNIVIRYQLQDLKQVSSWSSKERLTSQVVFDESSKSYIAVFNSKNIKIWSEDEKDLDNVKKIKFPAIHSILTMKSGPTILLLENGSTVSLQWVLENRKKWTNEGLLESNEKILNSTLIKMKDQVFLCAISTLKTKYKCIMVPLKEETFIEDVEHLKRFNIQRSSEKLVGHVIVSNKEDAQLLTLWSDEKFYSFSLSSSNETFPGTLISDMKAVNCKHPVAMVALNESTIAMYGADLNEEGAVLLIFNTQFKLVQASQKLKCYSSDSKIWTISSKILLASNKHLAFVPYFLPAQEMDSLLNSSLSSQEKAYEEVYWVKETKFKNNSANDSLQVGTDKIMKFQQKDFNNTLIQQQIIPELIKSEDIESIVWCLNNFKHLPEAQLVQLLYFYTSICNRKNCSMMEIPEESKISKQHIQHIQLFKAIFQIKYSDPALISYLKKEMNFDQILDLFTCLIEKVDPNNENIDNDIDHNITTSLFRWITLLIDSHYQDYLLSQDEKVLQLLTKLSEINSTYINVVQNVVSLQPLFKKLRDGQLIKYIQNDTNKFYSIEEVKLY
ncbi:uncharacterized protein LOC106659094 [Trichogramma pretiosum]|uniref:uncharacterized protein LOC106659094 n=1 Tax=Trichogramma pretiosum TaxID=7493 RepID=UPI0006C9D4F4|nr:uncharacterized protein LOC106659094 [Trichogramma pretiosum]